MTTEFLLERWDQPLVARIGTELARRGHAVRPLGDGAVSPDDDWVVVLGFPPSAHSSLLDLPAQQIDALLEEHLVRPWHSLQRALRLPAGGRRRLLMLASAHGLGAHPRHALGCAALEAARAMIRAAVLELRQVDGPVRVNLVLVAPEANDPGPAADAIEVLASAAADFMTGSELAACHE